MRCCNLDHDWIWFERVRQDRTMDMTNTQELEHFRLKIMQCTPPITDQHVLSTTCHFLKIATTDAQLHSQHKAADWGGRTVCSETVFTTVNSTVTIWHLALPNWHLKTKTGQFHIVIDGKHELSTVRARHQLTTLNKKQPCDHCRIVRKVRRLNYYCCDVCGLNFCFSRRL